MPPSVGAVKVKSSARSCSMQCSCLHEAAAFLKSYLIAMGNHTHMWLNEELSDVTISLVCVNPPQLAPAGHCECMPAGESTSFPKPDGRASGSSPQGDTAASALGVCMELPVHIEVLASASEYWKARFLRWCTVATATGMGEQPCTDRASSGSMLDEQPCAASACHKRQLNESLDPAACQIEEPNKKQKTDKQTVSSTMRAAGGITYIVQEHLDGPHEVEAARNVLQHAYTQSLPEDASLALLMQMAVHADRWDMPETLKACLDQAANLKELTVDDVNSLMSDDWPPSIQAHTSFVGISSAALLRLFGRAQAIVANAASQAEFCSLSLKAVQLWAEQDALKVDSENTVAVLLTHWWDKNSSSLNLACRKTACRWFTESLIAFQLSSTFLVSTLEKLPWFKPTDTAITTLRIMHGALCTQDPVLQKLMPQSWQKTARAQDVEQATELEWEVTKTDLDLLHKEAGKKKMVLYSPTELYWAGYWWDIGLALDDQKDALFMGMRYTSALPRGSQEAGVPPVMPATFELIVVGQKEPCVDLWTFNRSWPMHTGICGTDKLLGVPATPELRAHSYPPDKFWKDGKLHLRAQMKQLG